MQKQGIKNYLRFILSLASLWLLISCTNDSNTSATQNKDYAGYTGSALTLPSSIHIAETNSTQSLSASFASQALSPLVVATDPNTNFSTDPVSYYQDSEGNIALLVVNIFLCLLDSVSANDEINQGPYTVLFDLNKCEQSKENSNAATELYEITVDSYRKDDDEPQSIQVWFEDNFSEEKAKIVGEFVISDGQSSLYPYGLFEFRYSIYSDVSPDITIEDWQITDRAFAKSMLGSNVLPRLEFVFNSDHSYSSILAYTNKMSSVTELSSADLSSGQSRSSYSFEVLGASPDTQIWSVTGDSAIFNPDFLLIDSEVPVGAPAGLFPPTKCLSRNQIVEEAWSYNLYYADDDIVNGRTAGQRVMLNAGDVLTFSYTHTLANDRNEIVLTENPLFLSYYGDGSLSGFGISKNSGWYTYNLKDFTVLTSNETVPVNYITKAVEVLEASKSVDVAFCEALDINLVLNNTAIDPSTASEIVDPSVGLSDWPNI